MARYHVRFAEGRIPLPHPVEVVVPQGSQRRIVEVAVDRHASGFRVYLRGYEEAGSRFYHEIAKQMRLDSPSICDDPAAWVRFGGVAVRIGSCVPD